jgi:hypothetical protein
MADYPITSWLACPHSLPPDSGAREWHVAEGDSFIAGDALAKIDTDKVDGF